MVRSHVLLSTLLLLACPLRASEKATFLPHSKQTCKSRSANGREFDIQYRAFHWMDQGKDVYTGAVAYYAPGEGEFLWWGQGFTTKEAYLRTMGNGETTCAVQRRDTVLLDGGELVDFFADNGQIRVFHSNLKFPSIDEGWEYVAKHPDETSSWLGGKWMEMISLYKQLGDNFFRPEHLWLDARPYFYDSLAGVTKVDSTWQLEIKGADEPNRALVVLDSRFKLVKITRTPAPKE